MSGCVLASGDKFLLKILVVYICAQWYFDHLLAGMDFGLGVVSDARVSVGLPLIFGYR